MLFRSVLHGFAEKNSIIVNGVVTSLKQTKTSLLKQLDTFNSMENKDEVKTQTLFFKNENSVVNIFY